MEDSFDTLIGIIENKYGFGIPKEILEATRSCFHEVKINKNEILIHIGTRQSKMYFVVTGILRDYYIDQEGNDKTRFFMSEGSMCGAEGLLISEPSAACTEALENCTLLSVNCKDFRDMLEKHSLLKDMWIICLEMSLKYKIRRENSFLMKSAAERYIDFKKDNFLLEKRVSQKYIASYLGITPVSLSRIRRIIRDFD